MTHPAPVQATPPQPFVDDSDFQLYVGDALDVLRTLPDESVHTVVTSPPYFGLRDYGTGSWAGGDPDCDHQEVQPQNRDGRETPGGRGGTFPTSERAFKDVCGKCGATRTDQQLGLEPTPEAYVARMVEVFREVRRVLRKDGTCWINLGSSYFSEPAKGGSGPGGKNEARWNYGRASRGSGPSQSPSPERAPAYDSDGTAPQGSQDLGSACLGLCDEHLADFLSHRDRTLDTFLHAALDEQLPSRTGRDSERQDALLGLAPDAPAAVLESTILESWLPLRGECFRCDKRASDLSALRSDVGGVPAFAHSSACTPDTARPQLTSAGRTGDTEPSSLAWGDYTSTLKPKDLVPIPWMVAMALQADGWFLRSEIIWAKKNCMPESVTDRPTKSHEQVFLLTREPRYYFDQEAIREPHTPDGRIKTLHAHAVDNSHENYANMGTDQERWPNGGRNARSVWTIATQPYAEAHFATFPEELPRRCIAAGTSEYGCCPECGAPWERESKSSPDPNRPQAKRALELAEQHGLTEEHIEALQACGISDVGKALVTTNGTGRNDPAVQALAEEARAVLGGYSREFLIRGKTETIGWRPGCECGDALPVPYRVPHLEPCVVIDPFMGSGTVALVARKLGRRSIGIELSPEYAQLAARRLQQLSLLA